MIRWLMRWCYAAANFRDYPKELNRRAQVEQELWDCARGKRSLPDAEQCRQWAVRLGVPEWARQQ